MMERGVSIVKRNERKYRKTSEKLIVRESKIDGCMGVFAVCDIRKGSKVVEYLGKLVPKSESDAIALEEDKTGKFYLFTLNKKWDINGGEDPNEGPFLNHSCDPNCEAVNEDDKHVWIYALRGIKKGEELTYDYGLMADMADPKEHPCYCGNDNCRGLIIEEKEFKKYLRDNPSYKKKWEAKQKLKKKVSKKMLKRKKVKK